MPPNYPTSLDSLANPTATTRRNDPGFELHAVISTLHDIVEALEAKQGIGASTPDANYKTLRATAAGTANWGYYSPVAIAETILVADLASITFSSIAANWRSLMLIVAGATKEAVGSSSLSLQFNGDAGANYYSQRVTTNITTVTGAATNAAGSIVLGNIAGDTGAASSAVIWIPDYARTALRKVALAKLVVQAAVSNGAQAITEAAGFWNSASVISSVTLLSTGGSNLKTGTVATLYGLP